MRGGTLRKFMEFKRWYWRYNPGCDEQEGRKRSRWSRDRVSGRKRHYVGGEQRYPYARGISYGVDGVRFETRLCHQGSIFLDMVAEKIH